MVYTYLRALQSASKPQTAHVEINYGHRRGQWDPEELMLIMVFPMNWWPFILVPLPSFTRFWVKVISWWTIVSVWFLLYPSSIISDGQKMSNVRPQFWQKPLGVEISCGGLGEAFRLWPQGWAWGPFLWSLRALADSICSGWVAL